MPADIARPYGGEALISPDIVDDAAEARRARRAGWRAVAVLLIFYALAMLDRQVLSLLVGPIRADLGVSDFQIGLLQGLAFAVFFCLFGLPFGLAVDRFPRRLVVLGGVLLWAAATTASGFAARYGELFAARILVGAGEAALGPAAFSMLSDLFAPRRLTFALSIYAMGSLVGNAIAYAVAGGAVGFAQAHPEALHGFTAWQAVFVLVGAPGLLLSFLIFLVPEPPRRTQRAAAAGWSELMRFMMLNRRFFIAHLGGFSCMLTISYAGLAWTPTFLVRRFGWTIPQVGATMAIYSLCVGVVCFATSGKVVEWLWRRGHEDAHLRYYVVGSLIAGLVGALAFQAPSAPVYFMIAVVPALFLNLAAIAPAALQVVTPGELRGRVSAIYLLVTGLIGMTSGPALVSGLTQFVFRDDAKLNLGLSLTYAILGPLACLLFASGLGAMRDARARVVESD